MAEFTIQDEDNLIVVLGKSESTFSINNNSDLITTVSGTVALKLDLLIDKNVLSGGGTGGIPGTGFVDQARWLVIEKVAGETISALRLVRFSDADTVVYATNNQTYNEAKAVGIATNGAALGGTVRVLIIGIMEDSFFAFPSNTLLFLGPDGTIVSTPPSLPTAGYSVIVGEAPTNGVFSLSIREPVIL
jgi:hypothetical protein